MQEHGTTYKSKDHAKTWSMARPKHTSQVNHFIYYLYLIKTLKNIQVSGKKKERKKKKQQF